VQAIGTSAHCVPRRSQATGSVRGTTLSCGDEVQVLQTTSALPLKPAPAFSVPTRFPATLVSRHRYNPYILDVYRLTNDRWKLNIQRHSLCLLAFLVSDLLKHSHDRSHQEQDCFCRRPARSLICVNAVD